jgi:DNA-binding HxlR family transcriptional regulator
MHSAEWRGKRYDARAMVEEIVGCKWSLRVISAVRDGVSRPSEIERYCAGISTKVLNERFHKLIAFGVLERVELGAKRQHVEYRLTARGAQILRVLGEIEVLQTLIANSS